MNVTESSTEEAAPAPEKDNGGLQSLGELLLQSEPDTTPRGETPETGQGEDESSTDDAPLTKFTQLAEKLGVGLDELYQLELASGGEGETFTVGQMKDAFAESQQNALDKIEWEETKARDQRKLMQETAELQQIMAALPPGAVNEQTLAQIRERTAAHVDAENALTLQVIPEWEDDRQRESDIKGMSEHLQSYGFPPDYMANVVNHRQRKYIRDMWLLQSRMDQAIAQVKKGRPAKEPTARTPGKPKGAPITKESGGLKSLLNV